MADRLILHIGTPKSGTTYLQGVLWSNREKLAAAGVHLPLRERRDHNHAAGDLTGGAIRQEPGVEPTTWEDMVAGIDAIDGTALISEEMLANLREEGRNRIVESMRGTRLDIVITARDPVRQVPSMWQQSLKHRMTWDLRHFAEQVAAGKYTSWQVQQDLAGLVDRWSEVISPANIHVVTVPQKGAPPDLIWQRFASVLGIDPSGFAAPDEHVNTTLDSVQAEVLRQVNTLLDGRLDFPDPYVPVVRLKMVPALGEHAGGERIVLPPDYHAWAEEYARATIKSIETAGVDVVGDLEELVGELPTQGQAAEPDRDVVLRVALATLADMCVATSDTTLDFLEMRSRFRRTRGRLEKQRAEAEALRVELESLRAHRPVARLRSLAGRVRRRLG